MGKKKSTVLMVLLTIFMVVLCVLTAFPSMHLTEVLVWRPAVMEYDLGTDLGGGFYAYYYPTGVISETEYKGLDTAEAKESYTQYVKDDGTVTGLYLKNDPVYDIINPSAESEGENSISKLVVDEFESEFAKAAEEIKARYAKKGYSDYRVAVVDDFALRVQIPAYYTEDSETEEGQKDWKAAFDRACNTFGWFAKTGAMTVTLSGSQVDQLEDNEVTDIIKEFSVHTQYDTAFLKVTFTDLGKAMLDDFAYEVEAAEAAASASSSTSTEEVTLDFMVGDEALLTLTAADLENGYINTKYELKYPLRTVEDVDYVETIAILMNSALNNAEGFDIAFEAVPTSQVRAYGSVFGEYTQILFYIAMFAVVVALIAFSIVKMGRFGVVSGYATVSYLIITGLCFGFITGGVYEITLGTGLVFTLGLALMNALSVYTYNAIKAEAALGKTVDSSVKSGFNKTLWSTVDIYAVLLLGALALLIGTAGLQTLATQAIICIVTGAFCNLLFTRFVNYMFLSASKNKYKYFRIVREDNDDE